jgi:tetratricopeptide (TPR) repeat protein
MSELRKMNAGEFARRLQSDSLVPDKKFAFFIGAGCSVSSDIPGAGSLVKDYWLPKLQEVCAPDLNEFRIWLNRELPNYDPNDAAASYGSVIELLFLNPEDRQREIEKLCDGKFPGFGYAVLATLIAKYGGSFNVVITTNFDDLISDALYLFTPARPLVIGHESLAGYIRPTRTRPLVVKIHGDARLSPQNTIAETANIQKEVERQVNVLLYDRAPIFIGYGGNDKGIAAMLSDLPKEALPFGIYWVSGSEPQGALRPWLEEKKAIWVEKFDFDEMMLLIRDAFDLPHPSIKQVESVFQRYATTYETLSGRIRSAPIEKIDESLKRAIDRADSNLPDWMGVAVEAARLEETDPQKAEFIYLDGIKKYPQSVSLTDRYMNFLIYKLKDYDKAEEAFQVALETDPNQPIYLITYANFLSDICEDYPKAEKFYLRAVEADPEQLPQLGNFYRYLGRAEEAIGVLKNVADVNQSDPFRWNELGNVYRDSGLLDKAIECYQRAIKLMPIIFSEVSRDNLANVYVELKDYEKAIEIYSQMISANPKSFAYVSLAICYLKLDQKKKAEEYLEIARSLLDETPIYIRARVEALSNNIEEALINLESALRSKIISKAWVRRDPNFDFIRDDPQFKELIGD